MANVQHSGLTDPELHEPKGVASATSGQVYVADGAGSGSWATAGTVDTAKSLGVSGHITLPGGLIFQWGEVSVGGDTTTNITWPIAFPNACLQAVVCYSDNQQIGSNSVDPSIGIHTLTATGGSVRNTGIADTARFLAIGW